MKKLQWIQVCIFMSVSLFTMSVFVSLHNVCLCLFLHLPLFFHLSLLSSLSSHMSLVSFSFFSYTSFSVSLFSSLQDTDSERIYLVSLPRRERERIEFPNKEWINSRRNKPQKRKTSSLLHNSEADGGRTWFGRNSLRSDKTKDHDIQEFLETLFSKCSILVQLGACPRERSANFTKLGHMQWFSTTHCWQLALRKRYV